MTFFLCIYGPDSYTRWRLRVFDIEHTYFGEEHFQFHGTFQDYFLMTLIGYLLTCFSFGLLYPIWCAEHHNYFWENTSFQGRRFRANMTAGDCFWTFFIGGLLTVFTSGLGRPVAALVYRKLELENIALKEQINLAELRGGRLDYASNLEYGMADAHEALEAFSGLF